MVLGLWAATDLRFLGHRAQVRKTGVRQKKSTCNLVPCIKFYKIEINLYDRKQIIGCLRIGGVRE